MKGLSTVYTGQGVVIQSPNVVYDKDLPVERKIINTQSHYIDSNYHILRMSKAFS